MDQERRAKWRRDYENCIYAIEFSSGVVKVGRTNDTTKRLAAHRKDAAQHHVEITRTWFSPGHHTYLDNETALIGFCAERWPAASGREYFGGADFDSVVAYASDLPMPQLTDAELDQRLMREHRALAASPPLGVQIWNAFARHREHAQEEADAHEYDEDFVLLEDVAPLYEEVESVTARSMAKHYAADALVQHLLRYKLDSRTGPIDWQEALHRSRHAFRMTFLLRSLIALVGEEAADAVARDLWDDRCGEYGDELNRWVIEDGIDPAVLFDMARRAHQQIYKARAEVRCAEESLARVWTGRDSQGSLLGGES
ncbi:GIY-YIG nuclease family protein [Acrocarpospora sp. B8E8]|uniref:GIY-YIG nuclease family protein n=1 Tax=Acrocarpospora sp. B8E8 TaxID=3153572 RepID=UPI00325C9064